VRSGSAVGRGPADGMHGVTDLITNQKGKKCLGE